MVLYHLLLYLHDYIPLAERFVMLVRVDFHPWRYCLGFTAYGKVKFGVQCIPPGFGWLSSGPVDIFSS